MPEYDEPAGDAPAGDAPAGDAPAGDAPAGDAPAGDAPTGSQHDFSRLLHDFVRDLLGTFPELRNELDANLEAVAAGTASDNTVRRVREYCMERLPVRFFDILYQNDDMFHNDENDLYLLPGIDFRKLWNENITDATRAAIWKYLQLFLFDSVGEMTDGSSFGETARLFEAVDEEAFRAKLEETIMGMQEAFDGGEQHESDTSGGVPKASDIHEHLSSMMNGKLGSLAKEIAEETAAEMNLDVSEEGSVDDVFKKLLRNPAKLMSLVKSVGEKIDHKLKSGEIRESELVEEAAELVKRMKDTPGMGDLQGLMAKMGMGGGKMNMAGMEAQLARNMKLAKQRDRMRDRRAAKAGAKKQDTQQPEGFEEMAREADRIAAELLSESENRQAPKPKKPKKKRRAGK